MVSISMIKKITFVTWKYRALGFEEGRLTFYVASVFTAMLLVKLSMYS